MLFSLHTDQHIKDAVNIFGYAYGYNRICKHFSEFKYKGDSLYISQNDPQAQVQMFYMEPEWYNQTTMTDLRTPGFRKFHEHQYKIQGTHLEATKVWSHWIDSMNSVDEIWVGNNFAKEAVINSGIKTPTYVFEHGIDDMWTPKLRGQNSKVRFLHVDSGSPRKRADMVQDAFLKVFGNRDDAELTLKYHGDGEYSVMDLFNQTGDYRNIKKIYKTMSQEELVELFHEHDVLVYPSEGEGFGFIPLQALATGMPVISTSRWCSYDKFFTNNIIESQLGKTQHTGYDHGEVVLANFDSLVHLMEDVFNNITSQAEHYFKQADQVYKEYNWQNKCNFMLNSLIKRIGIDMLNPIDMDYVPQSNYLFFERGASYTTRSGVSFSSKSPVQNVPLEEYESLLLGNNFRIATEKEIRDYLKY